MHHEEARGRRRFPRGRWDANASQCSYQNSSGESPSLEASSMTKSVAILSDKKSQRPTPAAAASQSKRNTSGRRKKPAAASNAPTSKARRVRTGCLTCRERHLKCDEALPDCLNCRKRGRECKRGIRLNFLDINVHSPEHVPDLEDWTVEFLDESRDIASEYKGGLSRYGPYGSNPVGLGNGAFTDEELKLSTSTSRQQSTERSPSLQLRNHAVKREEPTSFQFSANQSQRSIKMLSDFPDECCHPKTNSDVSNIATPPSSCQSSTPYGDQKLKLTISAKKPSSPCRNSEALSPFSIRTPAPAAPMTDFEFSFSLPDNTPLRPLKLGTPKATERDYLNAPEEIRYMQVFVQEVGVWLDSFNKEPYFSHLIPHYALKSAMLLNAFLACGARHLSLTSPDHGDKAQFYHNTATSQLLRSLQNPDRNVEECTITAVILNAYEFMSEKPAHRMRHLSGARALILECGWNARSSGIGSACFWQSITMEMLTCLSTNWQTTWEPEEWGLNCDLLKGGADRLASLSDESFVHMMLHIVAKIVNFRATILTSEKDVGLESKTCQGERFGEWQDLKQLCDRWNTYCPRTMRSYGYLEPSRTSEKSLFPCIWLIQRTATLGQLLYHTAEYILAEHHPLENVRLSDGMRMKRLHHSHQVCGIIAHTGDRGVAPVAVRCLASVATVLSEPSEQVEVLDMMGKIKGQSGWHLGAIETDLKRAWGCESTILPPMPRIGSGQFGDNGNMPPPLRPSGMRSLPNPIPPLMTITRVLTPPTATMAPVNPLSFADFSLPNHPYQNWYEPPNRMLASEMKSEW